MGFNSGFKGLTSRTAPLRKLYLGEPAVALSVIELADVCVDFMSVFVLLCVGPRSPMSMDRTLLSYAKWCLDTLPSLSNVKHCSGKLIIMMFIRQKSTPRSAWVKSWGDIRKMWSATISPIWIGSIACARISLVLFPNALTSTAFCTPSSRASTPSDLNLWYSYSVRRLTWLPVSITAGICWLPIHIGTLGQLLSFPSFT